MIKLPKFLQVDENDSEEEKKKKKFLLILFPILSLLIVVGIVLAILFGVRGCSSNGNKAHEHVWGAPTYTWTSDYSSCTAERVCTEDASHKESETVNSSYTVVTSAQCETDGLGRYTVTFTNSAFTTQTHDKTIEATGHIWGSPTYEWNSDYSKCTATRVCQNNSSHKESETVNSSYTVVTPATREDEGLGRYTATFTNSAFATQTADIVLNKIDTPILSEDGKKVTYGRYPQTNVNDSTLVSALNALTTPESNGWYLYEDEYYAKFSATPSSSNYKFDNGTTIVNGTTYWFKCEPIVWNVLSNNDGEYYIISSVLLDAHRINEFYSGTKDGHYANNYQYSEIRAWLNDDFYNSVFALGNSNILTTNVDNSASTTNSSSNSYACDNTEDKIFLPSYQDYLNSSYGFPASTEPSDTRCCKTTDWTRARGAYYSTDSSYLYNAPYWTRSPWSDYSTYAWNLGFDGFLGTSGVSSTMQGVRPGLSITIA